MTTTTATTAQRRGQTTYAENPFRVLPQRRRRVINDTGDMMLVAADTGEIRANIAGFWRAQEVDAAKFVKIYAAGMQALLQLSRRGTRLFALLLAEVSRAENRDRDLIYFARDALNEVDKQDWSESAWWRGIAELSQKRFLARAARGANWYWLNPTYCFNGDRLVLAQIYYRSDSASARHNIEREFSPAEQQEEVF